MLKHGVGGLNIEECRVGTDLTKGRFLANIIHDGSEEVLSHFPTTKATGATDYDWEKSGDSNPVHKVNNIKSGVHYADEGSAARYFYCPKASPAERKGNPHPTVKPLKLMEYLVKLVKQPSRNLILDPFAGSGSILIACQMLGIPCIGIELSEEYCEIAAKRLRKE